MAYFPPTGSIVAFQSDPTKLSAGVSVIGLTPVNVTNFPTTQNVSGSVVALISGTPTVVVNNGSVVAFQGTAPWVVQSIVGTYAEDSTHTSADKGIFIMGVRNDAIASFVSANTEYAPIGVDSAGRTVTKPFSPEESRVEGTIAITNTSITTVIAAPGTGLKNYITDFFIANSGSITTLVTFKDGLGSVLGYTIAPATGGSNVPGMNIPMRTGGNATFDIQASNPTSTLYATFTGFKAP